MKKIIVMAVAAFMATAANAQFEKGTWSLQPFLGGGFSTITNAKDLKIEEYRLDKRVTAAYLTGVEAEYQFAKKFSVAAGVNYTSQGTSWEDVKFPGGTKQDAREAKLGYIKIPLVANFYIFKGFAVKAGVQFGFLVNASYNWHQESKEYVIGRNRDVDTYTSLNMMDDTKKFDFSLPVGVSYQFKVPIVIDARYQIGLTKVNKGNILGSKDCRNSVFTLTVGYKFAL